MLCPFCNTTIQFGSVCPHCKADVALYIKTQHVSNKLYNKGLSQAKAGDLAGAITSLKQSITFDKVNYFARNVLGLVYYETGRVGDALYQWIISASLVKEGNDAGRYIDALQKNGRELEKSNDAVRMYNHAIVYLQQKSEDLAVIQLKKAVDLNPKFIEAYNLLTLCYIIEENHQKAGACIDKVLEMDFNNEKALHYAKEINKTRGAKGTKGKQAAGSKEEKPTPVFHMPEKKRTIIGGSEVVAFFVGIICTVAVLMTLVLPAWADGKDAKIADLEAQVARLGATSTDAGANSASYQELAEENKRLQEQVEQYQKEETIQSQTEKITQAEALNEQGDAQAAALLLVSIDANALPENLLASYNTVKEAAYPKAAESFYNDAKSLFLSNDYVNALEKFENCLKFSSGENFVDDTLYYLGKIAESKGETEKAKEYYNRVVNEYPDSNQVKNAQNSLAEMES